MTDAAPTMKLNRKAADDIEFLLPMKRALHGLIVEMMTDKEHAQHRRFLPSIVHNYYFVKKHAFVAALRAAGFRSEATKCEKKLHAIFIPFRRKYCTRL